MKKAFFAAFLALFLLAFSKNGKVESAFEPTEAQNPKSEIDSLGRAIFFDPRYSSDGKMSCATCHDPSKNFQSDRLLTLADGSKMTFLGRRDIPTVQYLGFVGPLAAFEDEGKTVKRGGFFADGRADDLKKQCEGPLFNPIEMNLRDRADVVSRLEKADYRPLFEHVFGEKIFAQPVDSVFEKMAVALEAFQKSKEVSPFSSKFDRWQRGQADLTSEEMNGLMLFTRKGVCSNCHVTRWHEADAPVVLFSDFSYENVGLPPKKGQNVPDLGLFETTRDSADLGKFKVPTLRNVAKTAPYMHNGIFETLEQVVHFYNKASDFAAPEIASTANRFEVGELFLTPEEEAAIVAFLKTLSDE